MVSEMEVLDYGKKQLEPRLFKNTDANSQGKFMSVGFANRLHKLGK